MFHSVVWAGTRDISLRITDKELHYEVGFFFFLKVFHSAQTGFEQMRAKTDVLREDIDQFIIRYVDDELLNERLIRLENGFPTTQREKDDFEARQEKNMQV